MKTSLVLAGVVSLLSIFGGTSQAAVITSPGGLSLTPQIHDVSLPYESIVYDINGTTATLTASVSSVPGALDFVPMTVTNGSMNLLVNFTKNGNAFEATSGTITVGGNSQTFFSSSDLLEFGFSLSSQAELEFVFGPGTGTYGGAQFGVILHSALNNAAGAPVVLNSNFDTEFSNSQDVGNATSDTFTMVPEPGSLAILGLAVPALLRRRRR